MEDGPSFHSVGKVDRISSDFNSFLFAALGLLISQSSSCLASNAPSIVFSSLISLLCSGALIALSNSVKEIFDKSLGSDGGFISF